MEAKKFIVLLIQKFKMPHFPNEIEYSEKYADDSFEFRHVLLPKHIYKNMPRGRLLNEVEWRGLG